MASKAERDFILQGIAANRRNDGRDAFQRRKWTLIPGILPQTIGSCRMTQENGNDIITGMRLETDQTEPESEANDVEGCENGSYVGSSSKEPKRFVFSMECLSCVGGSFDSRNTEKICQDITFMVNNVLNGPESGIEPNKISSILSTHNWRIHINCLVLKLNGCLTDAVFISIGYSLRFASLPVFSISSGPDDTKKISNELVPIENSHNFPMCITFGIVGDKFIVDMSLIEEVCSSAKVSFVINHKGNVCSILKLGSGAISSPLMNEMLLKSGILGKNLSKEIDNKYNLFNSQEPLVV